MTIREAERYAPDSLVVRVGVRIRTLRMKQGLTLREFGKTAGLHPFHVMAIELGQLAANTKTLEAIAKGLGVTPVDLLNHGSDDDDTGAIRELLRVRPDLVADVKARCVANGSSQV